MSLNRIEQTLMEYVQSHPDERLYWEKKVQGLAGSGLDLHQAAVRLEGEIRRYCSERARFHPALAEGSDEKRVTKVSMRNLAEYWIRIWSQSTIRKPSLQPDEIRYGDL